MSYAHDIIIDGLGTLNIEYEYDIDIETKKEEFDIVCIELVVCGHGTDLNPELLSEKVLQSIEEQIKRGDE